MIGSVIKDTYRIDRYLGEGGPSIVYQGTDLLLGVPVAIKRLKHSASLGDGSSMAQRFLREARTHARLTHQNIVGIRAVLEENHEFFIVMEYVDGGDLTRLFRESPGHRLPITDAVDLFAQVLFGLDYAHRNGVVHRDIKPSNILITQDRCAKIADLGLARAVSDQRITGVGFLVGTLTYMSPEQLQGEEATSQSDLYSLGVSLYEGLAGFHPFAKEEEKLTPFEVCSRHLFQHPPPLHTFREDIPKSLSYVVQRSLAKKPKERYADAMSFAEELHISVEKLQSKGEGGHVARAIALQSGSQRMAALQQEQSSSSAEKSPATDGMALREEPTFRSPASYGEMQSSGKSSTPGRKGGHTQPLPSDHASDPPTPLRSPAMPQTFVPASMPSSGTREMDKKKEQPLRPPVPRPEVAQDTWLERVSPLPRSQEHDIQPVHTIQGGSEMEQDVAHRENNTPFSSHTPETSWTQPDRLSRNREQIPLSIPPDTWTETVSPLLQTNDNAKTATPTRSQRISPSAEHNDVTEMPEPPSDWGWKLMFFLLLLITVVVVFFLSWQSRYQKLSVDSEPITTEGLSKQDPGTENKPRSAWTPLIKSDPVVTSSQKRMRTPQRRIALLPKPKAVPSPPKKQNVGGATGASICSSLQGQMVYIPGGTFWRGYSVQKNQPGYRQKDAPSQKIRVSGFCMDRHEVTVGEYQRCVRAKICPDIPWNRSWRWKGENHPNKTVTQVLPQEQPMRYVRWKDAQLFCQWMKKRLPTEAEWEWAARGDEGWEFPWGKQKPTCQHAVHKRCRTPFPLPASEKRNWGHNPFGVFDLAGNVAEWVRDCYDPHGYHKAASKNPALLDPWFDTIPCSQRVVRGGSFRHSAYWLRSYARMSRPEQLGTAWIGFRCVVRHQ